MRKRHSSGSPKSSLPLNQNGEMIGAPPRPHQQVKEPLNKHKTKRVPPNKNLNPQSAQLTTPLLHGTLLSLEPRILLDGAAVLTGSEVTAEANTDTQPDLTLSETSTDSSATNSTESVIESLITGSQSSTRKEIVFIDTSVEDYQTLMSGIDMRVW